jgi:plasmid stabilization system protein ParE
MDGFAFHPDALVDLDEIWEFIAKDSVDAADRGIAEVLGGAEALETFPHRGHRRRDLTSKPLRFVLVHEYLIAYAPDEQPLGVVAVLHGRRASAGDGGCSAGSWLA